MDLDANRTLSQQLLSLLLPPLLHAACVDFHARRAPAPMARLGRRSWASSKAQTEKMKLMMMGQMGLGLGWTWARAFWWRVCARGVWRCFFWDPFRWRRGGGVCGWEGAFGLMGLPGLRLVSGPRLGKLLGRLGRRWCWVRLGLMTYSLVSSCCCWWWKPCVRERERERGRDNVSLWVRECERKREWSPERGEFIFYKERERERRVLLFTFSICFMGINLCLFAFVYFSFLFLFMGGDLCFIGYCVRGKCQGVGCVKYMHVVNNPYFYGVINFNNYLDFFLFFFMGIWICCCLAKGVTKCTFSV